MNKPDIKQLASVAEDISNIASALGVSAMIFFGFAFLGLCALQVMP